MVNQPHFHYISLDVSKLFSCQLRALIHKASSNARRLGEYSRSFLFRTGHLEDFPSGYALAHRSKSCFPQSTCSLAGTKSISLFSSKILRSYPFAWGSPKLQITMSLKLAFKQYATSQCCNSEMKTVLQCLSYYSKRKILNALKKTKHTSKTRVCCANIL